MRARAANLAATPRAVAATLRNSRPSFAERVVIAKKLFSTTLPIPRSRVDRGVAARADGCRRRWPRLASSGVAVEKTNDLTRSVRQDRRSAQAQSCAFSAPSPIEKDPERPIAFRKWTSPDQRCPLDQGAASWKSLRTIWSGLLFRPAWLARCPRRRGRTFAGDRR